MKDIVFAGELTIYNGQNMPYLGQLLLNQLLVRKGMIL